MQFRFKIRTLLISVAAVAIVTAYFSRLYTNENRRQYLVSDAYTYEKGTTNFNSYRSHSTSHVLSWNRWIGTKLAGTGTDTSIISVNFKSGATIDEIKEVLSLFPEIQRVHFHHTTATTTSVGLLSELRDLRAIQINDGRIDIEMMNSIGRLPQRPIVAFHNVHLDDSFLVDSVSSEIHLDNVYSPTSSVTDAGLHCVAKLENLWSLLLKDCQISDEGLTELQGHAALRCIYLENCPVGDPCIKTLTTIPNLHQLSLKGTNITDAGIETLLPIAGALSHIDICETAVTPAAISRLNLRCRTGALKFTPQQQP